MGVRRRVVTPQVTKGSALARVLLFARNDTDVSAAYAIFRWLLRIMLALAVIQMLMQWLITSILVVVRAPRLYDFSFYYVAALALREHPHVSIYDPQVMSSVAHAHHLFLGVGQFGYPLLLPILLIPLTLLSFQIAARVWFFFNLLLWMLNTALLIGWLRYGLYGFLGGKTSADGRTTPASVSGTHGSFVSQLRAGWRNLSDTSRFAIVFGMFVTVSYAPMIQAQTLGQASMLMLTCFLLVPWLVRRGHPEIAGLLLTAVTLIKIVPVILIAYYLFQRRWRVVFGAAGSLVLLSIGMMAVVGIRSFFSMSQLFTAVSAGALSFFQNESLARVPMWIAIETGGSPGAGTTALGDVLLAGIGLAFVVGMFVEAWRSRRQASKHDLSQARGDHELLGYSWALSTMILVSPVTWEHHDVWLLPAMMFCLGYAVRRAGSRLRDRIGHVKPEVMIALVIILAIVVTLDDLPLGYDGTLSLSLGPFIMGHPLRPFFMLLRPIGALLMWSAAGILFLRSRSQARTLASVGKSPEASQPASTDSAAGDDRRIRDSATHEGAFSLEAREIPYYRLSGALVSLIGALIIMRIIVQIVLSAGTAAPQ